MTEPPLLDAGDRAVLREFAVTAELHQPHLLPAGAQLADQFRRLIPALPDEHIAAVIAVAAHVPSGYAHATGCSHAAHVANLFQAAAVDLAHLELDPPEVR